MFDRTDRRDPGLIRTVVGAWIFTLLAAALGLAVGAQHKPDMRGIAMPRWYDPPVAAAQWADELPGGGETEAAVPPADDGIARGPPPICDTVAAVAAEPQGTGAASNRSELPC
jgi:hypothetical protein